jgi:hypothetical protein
VIDDLPQRYHEYLERFTRELGEVEVGAFAKFAGKLIKKLGFEDFTRAYLDYTAMAARYHESVARGDTINDVVLKILREGAATLVLPPPG